MKGNNFSKSLLIILILLVASKLLTLFHLPIKHFYIDLERLLFLIIFLTYYLLVFNDESIKKPFIIAFMGVVFLYLTAYSLNPTIYFLEVLIIFFMISLVEEIIRAYVIEVVFYYLRHLFLTILSTGLIFALVHKEFYDLNGYSFILLVMGVLFSALYLKLKNLFGRLISVVTLSVLHSFLIFFYTVV